MRAIRSKSSTLLAVTRSPEFRSNPPRITARVLQWLIRKRFGWTQWRALPGTSHLRVAYPSVPWAWERVVFSERFTLDNELGWLRKVLQPGMTAFDVGAHRGVWTSVMADAVGPTGHVIAFEPTTSTRSLLEQAVKRNCLSQVTVVPAAAGASAGVTRIYHHGPHGGENSLAAGPGSYDPVALVTVDQIANELDIDRLDALKIDVEGYEEPALRGAESTLRRFRPVVVFEATEIHAPKLQLPADGAWACLKTLGYQIFRVSDDGRLRRVETFGPPTPGARDWNYVALADTESHRQLQRAHVEGTNGGTS